MKMLTFQKFAVAFLLFALSCVGITAQGLFQGATRVDRCAPNSQGISMAAGDSVTITAQLPTSTDTPSVIHWHASGGIYFDNNGTPTTLSGLIIKK